MTQKKSGEKKHLPIEMGTPYFEAGCMNIGIRGGELMACSEYDGAPSENNHEWSEDFEKIMLTLYKLAKLTGTKVPANPYK